MGKGGGKAHTPREAKDNLKSTQMMSVIDAIGEGPIEGPVKGLQSILVNKTPTDGHGRQSRDTRCDGGLACRGAGADTTGRL
ncbi:hypothetical protein MS8320_1140 [Escherichia coli]|nr:hypothetical protein MS8320_1140 [Escherichia coli]